MSERGTLRPVAAKHDPYFCIASELVCGIEQNVEALFYSEVPGVNGEKFIRRETIFCAESTGRGDLRIGRNGNAVWKKDQLFLGTPLRRKASRISSLIPLTRVACL